MLIFLKLIEEQVIEARSTWMWMRSVVEKSAFIFLVISRLLGFLGVRVLAEFGQRFSSVFLLGVVLSPTQW